jgi:hypothetical protein
MIKLPLLAVGDYYDDRSNALLEQAPSKASSL